MVSFGLLAPAMTAFVETGVKTPDFITYIQAPSGARKTTISGMVFCFNTMGKATMSFESTYASIDMKMKQMRDHAMVLDDGHPETGRQEAKEQRHKMELAVRVAGDSGSTRQKVYGGSVKADVAEYRNQNERIKEVLASSWEEYKNYTAKYFEYYRQNKYILWNELQLARRTSNLEKKRIASILNEIVNSTDFIMIKAFKLLQVLFIAISNFHHENEIEKLQKANKELKTQARNIMTLSNDVSSVLKTKQLDDIEQSLKAYETALENAETFINEKMKALDIVIDNLEK
jgi:hypothetical protein